MMSVIPRQARIVPPGAVRARLCADDRGRVQTGTVESMRALRDASRRLGRGAHAELALWSVVIIFLVTASIIAVIDPSWAKFYDFIEFYLGWRP